VRRFADSACLSGFSNDSERRRNLRSALAWRRSRVRVSSGPLSFSMDLQVKLGEQGMGSSTPRGHCAATVQQRVLRVSTSRRTCGTSGCIHHLSGNPALRSCSLRTSTPRSCRRCWDIPLSPRQWTRILTCYRTCMMRPSARWRVSSPNNAERYRYAHRELRLG
jgi:hypothetical protein